VGDHECRACRGTAGHLVLDLGLQPACDYFPSYDSLGPDPVYPLQMWMCAHCGLAQLAADDTTPEEPKGVEPAALIAQAADAVDTVIASGLAQAGQTVAEYGSPHGGSWLNLLTANGFSVAQPDATVDLIVDCFGLMHAPDQSAALAERAARLNPGGLLLLQYHSLATILRNGQWNALRHGHYAYYSTPAMAAMLAAAGCSPCAAWRFDLYGGTVLLGARRNADAPASPGEAFQAMAAAESQAGVRDPDALHELQRNVRASADNLRGWLAGARAQGQRVLGYGAASRAVALLCLAGVDRDLLPAVADASPAKQGMRMPGTKIPVISPGELIERRPDAVLVFVSDLVSEVRSRYGQVEANGGRWVDADWLLSGTAGGNP
jgi:hypothetical protein